MGGWGGAVCGCDDRAPVGRGRIRSCFSVDGGDSRPRSDQGSFCRSARAAAAHQNRLEKGESCAVSRSSFCLTHPPRRAYWSKHSRNARSGPTTPRGVSPSIAPCVRHRYQRNARAKLATLSALSPPRLRCVSSYYPRTDLPCSDQGARGPSRGEGETGHRWLDGGWKSSRAARPQR